MIDLGINLDPTQPPALLEKKERFQHCYILGKSRFGKSNFLFHLIKNEAGSAQIVIDPAGGMAEQIREITPKHRLIYVSRENPLIINPLQRQGYESHEIANEFCEVINAIVGGISSSPDATILHQEIIRAAVQVIPEKDIEYMSHFLNSRDIRRKHQDSYWKGFEANREKVMAAGRVGARISGFCDGVMKRFTIGKNEFEVEEVIRGNKIAVFNLRGFTLIDQVYLGNLITHAVNSYFQLKATEQSQPLFFYVDEFHRFISPFFETMLSQCGKYNISLTLAHQDHKQISDKLLSTILGNCHTKVVFSCGYAEAKRMSEEFQMTPKLFLDLPKYEAQIQIGRNITHILTFPPPKIEIKKINFLRENHYFAV